MTALERENILPPLGHNNPPDGDGMTLGAMLRERMAEAHGPLLDRAKAIAAMSARLPNACEDDETAGKLTEAIKSATACVGSLETARKAEKQPHLDAGKAVDAFFANQTLPVEGVKQKMGALLTAYQRRLAEEERVRREAIAAEERRIAREAEAAARDAERIARVAREAEATRQREAAQAAAKLAGEARRKAEAEEAARRAAEQSRLDAEKAEADRAREAARAAKAEAQEAKDAANAKPADMTQARSDLGAVGSLRTTWHFEVTDEATVPREYLIVNEPAIRAQIKRATKGGGDCKLKIPGVRIYADSNTVVR